MGSLSIPFTVQLDGNGDGQGDIAAPALGYSWTCYIVLATATAGQTIQVQVSGSVVAWGGSQTGSFGAGSGATVSVAVSNGAPYSELQGVLVGNETLGNTPPLPPLQASGTLVELAGGAIEVTAGIVEISGGSGGITTVDQPPQNDLIVDGSFVAGAPQTMIQGVGGQSIRIRSLHLSSSAATQVQLQTTILTPAAIAVSGVSLCTNAGTPQSPAITVPATANVGDLALCRIVNTSRTPKFPTGWNNTSIEADLFVFCKYLTAADIGNPINIATQPSSLSNGNCVTYTNATLGPSAGAVTLVAPSVMARESGDWLLCDWATIGNTNPSTFSVTAAAGMTTDAAQGGTWLSGGNEYYSTTSAHLLLAAAGATATKTGVGVYSAGAASSSLALATILYENSQGGILDILQIPAAGVTGEMPWLGYPLPIGAGLIIETIGTTSTLNGRILYDQY